MALMLAGFIISPAIHIGPSLVALLGAGILILVSQLDHSEYLSSVEWDTLLFLIGLFIMIGALLKTGVIKNLAQLAAIATGGNLVLTTMLILGVSTLVSGVVDNVPYVATMTPIVGHLAAAVRAGRTTTCCGGRWRSAATWAAT